MNTNGMNKIDYLIDNITIQDGIVAIDFNKEKRLVKKVPEIVIGEEKHKKAKIVKK